MHLGAFDAEASWRDPDLARLPALQDPDSRRIVSSMDELLFAGCRPGDLLLTRQAMDEAFVHYLEMLGFSFLHNRVSLDGEGRQGSIFDLLLCSPPRGVLALLAGAEEVSPYAIVTNTGIFAQRYCPAWSGPELPSVIRVNSKTWSHQVAAELNLKRCGCQVKGAAELLHEGKRFLGEGKIVLKDPFGVSGRGSLVVESERVLASIAAFLAAQERSGKRVSLLIEPLLAKSLDFSCHLRIDREGRVQFLGVQQMLNRGLAFGGSCRLAGEHTDALWESRYFQEMEAVSARLFKDGYWGDVCVDSMWLQDGSVVPVVEVNARKSMGLINQRLDAHFGSQGRSSYLSFFSVGRAKALPFCELLEHLESDGLLCTVNRPCGIMPLSAATLPAGPEPTDAPRPAPRMCRGRFYFSILAPAEDREAFREKLSSSLKQSGFLIYG